MLRISKSFVLGALALMLSGCVSDIPRDGPQCVGMLPATSDGRFERFSTISDPLVADIAAVLERGLQAQRRGERSADGFGLYSLEPSGALQLNVLAISTGGQDGAFAAGVLRGLWLREDRDFGVVTGASAGALIAPVAFAGEDFAEDLELFNGLEQADIIRPRPLSGLLDISAYSTEPLKKRVRETFGKAQPDILQRIGERQGNQGLLLIGATDIDRGEFVRFDIGRMIANQTDRTAQLDCLVGATLASSAIPALFPPQAVDDRLYVDAGVRQHLFLEGVGEAVKIVREKNPGVPIDVRVTLLINNNLKFEPEVAKGPLLSLALRNVQIVGDEGMRASIRQALSLARANNWTVEAMAIPPDLKLPQGCTGDELFSKCYTEALFARGQKMGAEGTDWMDADALARRIATLGSEQ